ncbi:golgin subfamily A member 1 isoform X1 [Scophthalmus maximus]|uniref:golgin subfamily A member 1 isoform X1 n=1 Tax=Scophthalmus maximus TaxID=52904 RepID=UPI001FA8E11C|nr:golgin subfamily A member 1 isoform X1 [Scophthalmus maximus]
MFAKLKKKIAEEAATAPRSGVRIPRTISKESITSVGADSGDDFASDGSSSRDDLPAQLLRRNDQIRRLEAKLSDYAEQLRIMQKTKDKLEIALERHQDLSIKKFQDQNETHQASRAKMAEGMTLALEKKDQEWIEKMADVEKEKTALSAQLEEMMEQSLALFQKRDDLDELEGFQQQELAKVKHMLLRKEEQLSQQERELQKKDAEVQSAKRELSKARGKLQLLEQQHEESCRLNTELEIEREDLLLLREEADKKTGELEGRCQELHSVIQQVSEDFQKSQCVVSDLEKSLSDLQTEHDALKLQQQKAAVTEEDKERLLADLQKKVTSLDRRLQGNLSQDEHLQELLQEKSSLEQSLEETRAELLAVRTNHADTVSSLEAQVSRMSCSITELQTLLRHKDDSSRAYRERTDTQVAQLEQQILESSERLKSAQQQFTEKQQQMEKLRGVWSAEKAFLEQQVCLLQQQSEERGGRLEDSITSLEKDKLTLQDRVTDLERQRGEVDSTLRQQTEELEQCRSELSSRQTVSTEIAKALEESRRQKEELQTQVGEQATFLQTSQQQLTTVTERLAQREEDVRTLQNEVQSGKASQIQLQEEGERLRAQLQQVELDRDSQLIGLRKELLSQTQQLDGCQARVSYLEVEVDTLTEQLHSPEVCEEDQNGSVTVDDLDHIQKVNRELEQQLSDKNKTIKQLQQRLAELKRTLQKELKLKPDPEAEGKEKLLDSRAEKQERFCPEPPPASALSPPTSNTTVTNTSDLNDSREINFEYLKHVVLKFMSSREAEAFQLIRAVSVLLNFTREEEDMLKQTLEYKMSWFGSKPSPKGIIRPSVSGASSPWS